jgi:hypothetical protein
MLGIEPRDSRSRSARYTKLSYISSVAVDGFEPPPVRLMRPLPYQLGDTAWCVERDLNSQRRRRRSAFTARVLHHLHIHTLVGEERFERSCPCERQGLSLLGLPDSPIRRTLAAGAGLEPASDSVTTSCMTFMLPGSGPIT